MKTVWYGDFPLGRFGLVEEDGALTHLLLPGTPEPAGCGLGKTPLLQRAAQQLGEYFAGRRQVFDLPLSPRGTLFQCRVWEALQKVPYGETCTYKDLAVAVGIPKGFRAVGMANHCNPIAILIPCHRVVGTNGSLTGYAGGLDMKAALLKLEQGSQRNG
ncbi:MAG: methylated-DNA--[protein]-cysteine S-methyltransferase [Oscillospiraceae bacterium]|jgi:methylated-DNA-[protein]-cysteine S-methyltransferase|nr:methylated-DNA--[protein]-cysteine S-methyltransferase [Oscillospiraceae bacterium]